MNQKKSQAKFLFIIVCRKINSHFLKTKQNKTQDTRNPLRYKTCINIAETL